MYVMPRCNMSLMECMAWNCFNMLCCPPGRRMVPPRGGRCAAGRHECNRVPALRQTELSPDLRLYYIIQCELYNMLYMICYILY